MTKHEEFEQWFQETCLIEIPYCEKEYSYERNGDSFIINFHHTSFTVGNVSEFRKIGEYQRDVDIKIIFLNPLGIDLKEYDFEIPFVNCEFNREVIVFDNQLRFNKCKFLNGINFNYFSNNSINITRSLILYEVKIHKNFNIKNVDFENNIDFGEVEFHCSVDLRFTNFKEKLSFNAVTFYKSFSCKNLDTNLEFGFLGCTFRELTCFENTKFHKNIRFHNCHFQKEVDFKNTSFNKLVDFYGSKFRHSQKFNLTDFNDRAIFSNVTFHEEVQFLHNKVSSSSYVSFEEATFKKGLDISRANFHCQLQFWEAKFDESHLHQLHTSHFYQQDGNLKTQKLDAQNKKRRFFSLKEKLSKQEKESRTKASKKLRETFRIIKHSFKSKSDLVTYQEYHRYEMEEYKRGLKYNENAKPEERFLLFLNEFSNNFGQSWARGFFFTSLAIGLSLIIYLIASLFMLDSNSQSKIELPENLLDLIKLSLQMTNIKNWNFKPFGVDMGSFGYILLFFSRLFIGYGIYQFVQALRKYGKY